MKKENANKENALDKEIQKFENELASHYSDKLYKTAEYALFRIKTNFYEGGEKNGRLLARQLRHQDTIQ